MKGDSRFAYLGDKGQMSDRAERLSAFISLFPYIFLYSPKLLVIVTLNSLIAVGTYRYNLDGYLELLFEEADVVVELLGELIL